MDQQTTTKDLTDPRKMTCWWKVKFVELEIIIMDHGLTYRKFSCLEKKQKKNKSEVCISGYNS